MPMTSALRLILALFILALFIFALAACGDETASLPDPVTEFTTEQAQALYLAHCVSCHARDGSGSVGPAIAGGTANQEYTREEMIAQVRDGEGSMPPFSDRLTESEMAAIVDYVRNDLNRIIEEPELADESSESGTPAGTDPEEGTAESDSEAVPAIPPELQAR